MADAITGATAIGLLMVCATDDPPFRTFGGVRTKWVSQ